MNRVSEIKEAKSSLAASTFAGIAGSACLAFLPFVPLVSVIGLPIVGLISLAIKAEVRDRVKKEMDALYLPNSNQMAEHWERHARLGDQTAVISTKGETDFFGFSLPVERKHYYNL